ncbi:DUF1905 domain-containing protein [Microbacterium sp. NPDC091313]
MHIEFDARVYRWEARVDSDWFFADMPEELSEGVREIAEPFARGFGAVRVSATIGSTAWRTSIFPSAAGRYALPLKRAVRDAEGLVEGGSVRVALDILDA